MNHAGLVVLALVFSASLASGQVVDRTRVETIAAGQAAEADRLFKKGEFQAALPIYEAERTSRAALGDFRYEAYALRAMGLCRAELGDDEAAIETYDQARVIDLKREDKGYAGYDDFLTAEAHLRLNRPVKAIEILERALPLLSQAVDRDHETDARLVLTRTLVTLGRAQDARVHVARALTLADELGDAARRADAWASAGQVEGSLGQYSLALERFSDAQEAFERQGRAPDAAWMETSIASTLLLIGRSDLALPRYEEAARLHQHLDDGSSLAEDLTAIAGLHLEANQLETALKVANRAVETARDADDRGREVDARVRLAQVQGARLDWPAASETMDEAVSLIRQVARDDPAEQIRLLLTAAETDHLARNEARAIRRFETAAKVADDSGLVPLKQFVADARKRFDDREKVPHPPQPPKG